MATYIALLRKDPDSDFSVDFPDFPGCITAGLTLGEARLMAVEALTGHIAGMVEDDLAIPSPSDLEAIMADPHNRDAVGFLVCVPTDAPGPIHLNVTLPEDLVQEIDRATTDRSRFLAEAARAKLREAA